MKRKFLAITIAALLVVGAVISIAFSQGYGRRDKEAIPPGPGYGPEMMRAGHGPGLGLCLGYGPGMSGWASTAGPNFTEEQVEKLQSLRTKFSKETLELHNEMQLKAMELRNLWTADELDDEAILAQTKEISALRNQLQEKATRHRLDMAKVLTKEQRTQILSMRLGRRSMGFGRQGPRPGRESRGYGHGRRGKGRKPCRRW